VVGSVWVGLGSVVVVVAGWVENFDHFVDFGASVGADFAGFVVYLHPYFCSFFWGSLVDRGFERIENHLVEQERGDEQELAEQEQLEEQQRVEQRVVEDQQAQY